MGTLKKRFRVLRQRRDEISEEIGKLDEVIGELDKQIDQRRAKVKTEASGDFDAIGKANRDISATRGKITQLEDDIEKLYHAIGRQLCSDPNAPGIPEVIRPHRRLVVQIKLLRDSVHMNRILGKRYKDAV